jgi:hypothetical protein
LVDNEYKELGKIGEKGLIILGVGPCMGHVNLPLC